MSKIKSSLVYLVSSRQARTMVGPCLTNKEINSWKISVVLVKSKNFIEKKVGHKQEEKGYFKKSNTSEMRALWSSEEELGNLTDDLGGGNQAQSQEKGQLTE